MRRRAAESQYVDYADVYPWLEQLIQNVPDLAAALDALQERLELNTMERPYRYVKREDLNEIRKLADLIDCFLFDVPDMLT